MSVTGDADGAPTKVAVAVADLFAGMNATQSVLAAIIARDRYGIGQHIDIALLDGQVAAMLNVSSAISRHRHSAAPLWQCAPVGGALSGVSVAGWAFRACGRQ